MAQIQESEQSEQSESIENKNIESSFEEMRLKVGHKLQLRLSSHLKVASGEENRIFHTATLFGYVQSFTLIVSMPSSHKLTGEPFLEGDQAMVRLFSGQSVYSFTVYVDKIIKSPLMYMHLSFPKHISSQTIRKSRRINCNILASIPDQSTAVAIKNLSVTGAQISSINPIGEIDAAIMLSFAVCILNTETSLSIKSIIKSIDQTRRTRHEPITYGLEFRELDSNQANALRTLIYQEIAENPNHAT